MPQENKTNEQKAVQNDAVTPNDAVTRILETEEKAKIEEESKGFEEKERVLAVEEKPDGSFKVKARKVKDSINFGKFKESKKRIQDQVKSDFIKSLKFLAETENLKSLFTNPRNLTLGMSGLALAVSVCAFISAASTPQIDKNNAFVKLTEVSPDDLGVPTRSFDTSENAVHEEDNSVNLDPSKQAVKGLSFADEADFKNAVSKALSQIRQDEVKAFNAKLFEKYTLASDKTPNNLKMYGNPEARFTMYEFSDVECPYCKNFFSIPKEVVDISNSQVSLVWKNFPLQFHDPVATQEAIAVECALQVKGNKASWVALDKLFSTTGSNGKGSSLMKSLPLDLGLDENKYLDCLNKPETLKALEKDKADAVAEGVSSTPSLVIVDNLTGRKTTLSGAVPAEQIINAIESLNADSQKEKTVENTTVTPPVED